MESKKKISPFLLCVCVIVFYFICFTLVSLSKEIEFKGAARKSKQETKQWSEMRDLSKQFQGNNGWSTEVMLLATTYQKLKSSQS